MFTLHDNVLKSIPFLAEAVLKPGSHFLSLEPCDFINVSAVDHLVVKLFQEHQRFADHAEAQKLEAAAQQQKKKDTSNFIVPYPLPGLRSHNVLSSLSSSTAIGSIVSPRPTAMKRVHNNLQDALEASINVNETEEKENSSAKLVSRRKKQPVLAGVNVETWLNSAMGQKDPTVDMFLSLLFEMQRSKAAAEERHHWKAEAAAEEQGRS